MAIFTYHHIGVCPPEQRDHPGLWVTPEAFGAQLDWLRNHGVSGLHLDQVLAGLTGGKPLPSRWVALTFDDGWRDNLTAALPVLEKHGFPATVFMVTGKVRTGEPAGRWDEYLSAQEIREMQERGVAFGSHTVSHPRLAKLSGEEVKRELEQSRDELAAITGTAPWWLCYPYGSFSPQVADIARDAGYAGALSTIRDNRPRASQLYWLPRVMIMGDTAPSRLRYMLSPFYHYLHTWKNRKRWESIR